MKFFDIYHEGHHAECDLRRSSTSPVFVETLHITPRKERWFIWLAKIRCLWLITDLYVGLFAQVTIKTVFARAILCLICRARNTVKVHMDHVSWSQDALVIEFWHTLTDQTGLMTPQQSQSSMRELFNEFGFQERDLQASSSTVTSEAVCTTSNPHNQFLPLFGWEGVFIGWCLRIFNFPSVV